MKFPTFCARSSIPVELMQAFGRWLSDIKHNNLPLVEWRVLWEDFISERSSK